MKKGFTLTLFAFLFSVSLMHAQTLEVTFSVTSPDNIARGYEIGLGGTDFGFQFANGDNFTADLVWGYAYTDSTQVAQDSLMCPFGPVANPDELAGNIALIRRGACFFSDKVYQAQNAGAIGAVICNNTPGDGTINMGAGGDFAGLDTIPVVSLSFEDCAILADAIAAGETVSVEINAEIATFLEPVSAYSYHTPQSQIIPLDAMSVNLANAGEEEVEAMATATITEPSGNVVEIMASALLAPSSDTTLFFEAYTPSGEVGTYNVEFTSNMSDDVLSQPFAITEHTFAPDNGNILGGVGPSDDAFINSYNLTYNSGSLSYMGADGGAATYATFGLANAEALYTGDAASDLVSVVVYQGDADGDGIVDLTNTFDDLIPVAIGEYTIQGTEGADQLLDVPLLALDGSPMVNLEANMPYYTTIQYSGLIAGTGVAPQFLGTSAPNYPSIIANQGLTTPLFLDALYSGWTGLALVTRLQMDGYAPVDVSTNEVLESAKLSVTPNPATDFVNVEFNLEEQSDNVRIRLLNIEGRLMQSIELNKVTSYNYQLNVQDLVAGTYILSITTPEGSRAEKLIITK